MAHVVSYGNKACSTQISLALLKLAIHSVASDLGANDTTVRQTLHARGILTLGIPKTVEPITPHPTPQAILDYLNTAGLNRKRTPYPVQLACAYGYSRPVVESQTSIMASATWSR